MQVPTCRREGLKQCGTVERKCRRNHHFDTRTSGISLTECQRISTISSFSVISLSTSFHDVKQKDARENNLTLLTGKEEASNLGAMQRQGRELHRHHRVDLRVPGAKGIAKESDSQAK